MSLSISAIAAASFATCAAMRAYSPAVSPTDSGSFSIAVEACSTRLATSPVVSIALTVASVSGRSSASQSLVGPRAGAVGAGGLGEVLGRVLRRHRQQHADQRDAVGDAVMDADDHRLAAVVVVDQLELPQRPRRIERGRRQPAREALQVLGRALARQRDAHEVQVEVEVVVLFPVVAGRVLDDLAAEPAVHARSAAARVRAGARSRAALRTRRCRQSSSDCRGSPSAATRCRRTTSVRACPSRLLKWRRLLRRAVTIRAESLP